MMMRNLLMMGVFIFLGNYCFGQKSEHYFQLASIQYEEQNYSKAIEYLNEAIRENASSGKFYYLRGLSYLKIKELQSAKLNFTECIKIDGNGMAYYQRGTINISLQDYDKAIKDFTAARDVGLDYVKVYYYLGYSYYQKKEYEMAIQYFDAYQKREKSNYQAYYYKGMAESKMSMHANAMKSLKKAAKIRGERLTSSNE